MGGLWGKVMEFYTREWQLQLTQEYFWEKGNGTEVQNPSINSTFAKVPGAKNKCAPIVFVTQVTGYVINVFVVMS